MAIPAKKSDAINQVLEELTIGTYGRSRLTSIENDVCVTCGGPAKEFKDALSKKEFTISGMCQKCQDGFFDKVDLR